jgi:hypothetical protein
MLVAVPAAAPETESGQKWPKMALHSTNFCDMAISHVLAHPPGLDRFAALSHSAGLRAACEPLHFRGGEPKAIRL